MTRPAADEYAPFYAGYVAKVPDGDILATLAAQQQETAAFLRTVPENEAGKLHPPYTWTPKQVLAHLIEGERIFGYRALRFARADETPLPGFDENPYAETAEADRLLFTELAAEFTAVRTATVYLFRHLPPTAWYRAGSANGSRVTVRALAWIIAGHERHHMDILRKRLERT